MKIIKKFNLKLNFFLKNLKINNNYIKNIQIIIESFFYKNKKNIFVLNPLTSNHHSIGIYKYNLKKLGWWYNIQKLFFEFNFITISNFCNSNGSTDFSNKNPFKNKIYNFNLINLKIEDLIKIQKISLKKIYIINIFLLIGGSFGGIQILIWNLIFPSKIKFCICISSTNYINNKNYTLNKINKLIINYNNFYFKNLYFSYKYNYIKNLKISRNLNYITYLSFNDLKKKKYNKIYNINYNIINNKKKLSKYLNYKCNKFILNFDINNYLFLINIINKFYIKIKKFFLKNKNFKIYLLNFKNDFRFNKKSSINILRFFIKNKIKIFFKNIKLLSGHDSFLIKNFYYFNNLKFFKNFIIGEIGFEPIII